MGTTSPPRLDLKCSGLRAVLIFAVLVPALLPQAATVCPPENSCWTGAAGDGSWESGSNWSNGVAPRTYARVSILLPFPGPSLVMIDSAPTLYSLTIGEGATIACTERCKLTVLSPPSQPMITSRSQLPFIKNSGTVTNAGSIHVSVSGTIILSGGDDGVELVNNSGNTTNTGGIVVESGAARFTNTGSITNNNGGTISLFGGGAQLRNEPSGKITNSGILIVKGGSAGITNSGIMTNFSDISVEGGAAYIANAGIIVNNYGGGIRVLGGGAEIRNSGTITNSGILSVDGGGASISNNGKINNCRGGKISGPVTGTPAASGCPSDLTITTQATKSISEASPETPTTRLETTPSAGSVPFGLADSWPFVLVAVVIAAFIGAAVYLLKHRRPK